MRVSRADAGALIEVHRGIVYRGLTPSFQHVPYSGGGAYNTGGRYNPKTVSALYTSFEKETVAKELDMGGGMFMSHTAISMNFESTSIIDLTKPNNCEAIGLDFSKLNCDHSDPGYDSIDVSTYAGGTLNLAPSKLVALAVLAIGADAAIVPAHHKVAPRADEKNVILYEWNVSRRTWVEFVDIPDRVPDLDLTVTHAHIDRAIFENIYDNYWDEIT